MTRERDELALLQSLTSEPVEATWLEFKQNNGDPQLIGEYISALSNAAVLERRAHAYMVWGVRDSDHMVVGTSFNPTAAKKGNEALQPWLSRLLEPQVHFEFRSVNTAPDVRVWILEIEAARSRPVSFYGTEWVRVGPHKHKLSKFHEIERKLWKSFETDVFEAGSALDGAREEEVLQLLDYSAYYELNRLPLPRARRGYLEQFENDGLIVRGSVGWSITNLGAILFARDLSRFSSLSRKRVRVVHYDGNNRVVTKHEQQGERGYASGFEGLVEYVNSRLPRREVIGEALRTQTVMYPELAVRELLANMLIHQDFTVTGAGPMVEIFDGRVEITNPGIPVIDAKRFVDYPARSRNEKLAEFMTTIGVSEQRGSGWEKIASLAEHHELASPDVTVTESTKVTLFAPKPLQKMTRAERLRAVYMHACLRQVSDESITNASVRERFGIDSKNSAQASRLLGEAVEDGLLVIEEGSTGPRNRRYLPFWAAEQG
ncbi:ATP-binding protein [Leifsonia sp. L25]|uniref:ATP-binding protein n=1 Tax=Actinomycetes TaxID=1760 RepID=UPI003D69F300